MLTGDNQATATAVALEAGIAQARGDLLPEAQARSDQDVAARSGTNRDDRDGINDAPLSRKPTSAWQWARPAPIPRWKQPMSS